MKYSFLVFIFLGHLCLFGQVSSIYKISFPNAIHHEAEIEVEFRNIKSDTATFRMSRTSPGRYAIHEFAKNVYNVQVSDSKGKAIKTYRTDPYSWHVTKHDGIIRLKYTLFANHGDGTYAQIDETHAHLNIPSTFMYMEGLENKEIEIEFVPREDLGWKIATQLLQTGKNKYWAKNLQYFMDSPVEISDYKFRSFDIPKNEKAQTIKFILHDNKATEENFDDFILKVRRIVLQQKAIFEELPDFDYNEYLFLACYMPQVDGDGMEHRNSTVLTTTRSLADPSGGNNIGTVSHEFFHCWNVERIRPKSLEPFDFTEANMSGELWFAEGFTNYYTGLSMVRAGIYNPAQFLSSTENTINYVWTSPGTQFFNPIEMSYQAPFVDAARSVDETNRENTFVSYYSYGEVLGLALDLILRKNGFSLDDYMKYVWEEFGEPFKPYTINDLQDALAKYSTQELAEYYFNNYIYDSKMPPYQELLQEYGVEFTKIEDVGVGARLQNNKLVTNPKINSTAYHAGLQKEDKILSLNGELLSNNNLADKIKEMAVGDEVTLVYERNSIQNEKKIRLYPETSFKIVLINEDSISTEQKKRLQDWLGPK